MSIPRDLLLKSTPEGVRLFQQPAAIVNKQPTVFKKDVIIHRELPLNISSNAYWIDATFTPEKAAPFGFYVAQKDRRNATIIRLDVTGNKLEIKQMKNDSIYAVQTIPIQSANKPRLQLLFDKSSLEIFVNGGKTVFTTLLFPKENETGLSVWGDVKVDTLKVWDMR